MCNNSSLPLMPPSSTLQHTLLLHSDILYRLLRETQHIAASSDFKVSAQQPCGTLAPSGYAKSLVGLNPARPAGSQPSQLRCNDHLLPRIPLVLPLTGFHTTPPSNRSICVYDLIFIWILFFSFHTRVLCILIDDHGNCKPMRTTPLRMNSCA